MLPLLLNLYYLYPVLVCNLELNQNNLRIIMDDDILAIEDTLEAHANSAIHTDLYVIICNHLLCRVVLHAWKWHDIILLKQTQVGALHHLIMSARILAIVASAGQPH